METVGAGEDEAHLENPCPGLISRQAHQSNKTRQRAVKQVISEQRVSDVKAATSNLMFTGG